MKRDKRMKTVTILILFMAVVGLTMGFAAFSSTLIVDSTADVKPDSSDFKLVIYGYDYAKNREPENFEELSTIVSDPFRIVGAESASQAKISNASFSITNLHASFTEPSQSVSYAFIINNEGGYDAYLNGITFDQIEGTDVKKICQGAALATDELVNEACKDINLSVEIKDKLYYDTENLSDNNIVIPKGEFIEFFVHIRYDQYGGRADGDFSIDFGDILLDFCTIES